MFRKIVFSLIFAACALLVGPAAAQDGDSAVLRILNLDNSSTVVAATFEDGQRLVTTLNSGSSSEYVTLDAERSTYLTVTFAPRGGTRFNREWSVPPLAPGHYTAAIVGRSTDITLQLIFIDEDSVCEGKLEAGSCIILINNVSGLPPVTVSAGSTLMVENAAYRHAVVNGVAARSYLNISAVNANLPDTILFQLQRGFFAPNVISLYTLTGNYANGSFSNASVGTLRRVPVDSMTFLRGLTGDLNLTGGSNLIAAENVVALLETAGYASLLGNTELPLTLFAPTDEAIVDAAELYTCALANPAALRTLILSHIAAGSYSPTQLLSAGRLPTMGGSTHSFRASNGGFFIDDTFVPEAVQYPTANGYVYLIDTVLIPPGFEDRYCSAG